MLKGFSSPVTQKWLKITFYVCGCGCVIPQRFHDKYKYDLISSDLRPPLAIPVLLFVSLLESAKICQLWQLSHTKHASVEKDIEEYYLKVWPAFKGRQRVTIVLKSYFPAQLNIQGAFNKLSVVGERRLGAGSVMTFWWRGNISDFQNVWCQ